MTATYFSMKKLGLSWTAKLLPTTGQITVFVGDGSVTYKGGDADSYASMYIPVFVGATKVHAILRLKHWMKLFKGEDFYVVMGKEDLID